jgi:hypothetical protein
VSALTWKTIKPTKPGWYFMKGGDGKTLFCVEVVWNPRVGLILGDSRQLVSQCGLAWAGPLKVPVDAQPKPMVRWEYHGKTKDSAHGPYFGHGEPIYDRAVLDRLIERHRADTEWLDVIEQHRRGGRWKFAKRWRAIGATEAAA